MSTELVAAIIQAEGGRLGLPGMAAVAWVLARQTRILCYDDECLKRRWPAGTAKPGSRGGWWRRTLAEAIESGVVLGGEYEFCKSQQDVDANGWRRGDYVVSSERGALHLYREWPERVDAGRMGRADELPETGERIKRGMHWTASMYPAHANYQWHLDWMVRCKIGWVKYVADGNASPGKVTAAWLRRVRAAPGHDSDSQILRARRPPLVRRQQLRRGGVRRNGIRYIET